jgi:hypothetical protein
MVTTLARPTATELTFGDSDEIQQFAARIKLMMRGGDKLTGPEALALAQVSKVTGLNPFIGECWYIPGSGPMIGIAGARRLDQEQTAKKGGYSFPIVAPCSPEEAGALEHEVKDIAAAFKTEIQDSAATADYQKLFVETLQCMRQAGVEDPFSAAKEICGPRPIWTGYGFSKKNEQTRMNKTQAARKRSEADALKKRIVVPFGVQVAELDVAPAYDAEAEVKDLPRRSVEQNLADLGFGPQTAPEPEPDVDAEFPVEAVQMYRYNDAVIVNAVRKIMDLTPAEAAATLHESHKANKIGKTLTLAEAELFARELIAPK